MAGNHRTTERRNDLGLSLLLGPRPNVPLGFRGVGLHVSEIAKQPTVVRGVVPPQEMTQNGLFLLLTNELHLVDGVLALTKRHRISVPAGNRPHLLRRLRRIDRIINAFVPLLVSFYVVGKLVATANRLAKLVALLGRERRIVEILAHGVDATVEDLFKQIPAHRTVEWCYTGGK